VRPSDVHSSNAGAPVESFASVPSTGSFSSAGTSRSISTGSSAMSFLAHPDSHHTNSASAVVWVRLPIPLRLNLPSFASSSSFTAPNNGSLSFCSAKLAVPDSVRYSIAMEPRGIYRERNGWGDQHSVRVRYDEHQELDLAESRYRERGYKPPFDELPWKNETENNA